MNNAKPYLKTDFPKAILHVDGDGFFAGCEVAKNPSLRGKPVVVGRERGMALAMTQEAKAAGVVRGMTLTEVRRMCPNAVFVDSDHESYALFSGRMNNIIERYTNLVERYSVDESFAELTGLRGPLHKTYEMIGREIKETLKRELGMTFSIGIAPTKSLAKLASKHNKPDGLTMVPGRAIHEFLATTPIERVWGIGGKTSAYLRQFGIATVLDFTERPEHWVTTTLAKPYQDIWYELRGTPALELHIGVREPQQSLMRTRTFSPTTSRSYLLAELSRHTEVVCARAREHGLSGKMFSFFLKTQGFRYTHDSYKLPHMTNTPETLIALIHEKFDELFDENALYRATGVTLSALSSSEGVQLDLFDTTRRAERTLGVHRSSDALNRQYGEPVVHLASSTHVTRAPRTSKHMLDIHDIERLPLPMLGSIS